MTACIAPRSHEVRVRSSNAVIEAVNARRSSVLGDAWNFSGPGGNLPRGMRRPFRRVAALISSLLLLQLVLVGSGFACAMPMPMGQQSPPAANAASTAVSDMVGMDMSGSQREASSKAPASDRSPCRFPWAPAGCQSMAPCAPVAMAQAAEVASLPVTGAYVVAALDVLTPPSRSTPPELPPPKA